MPELPKIVEQRLRASAGEDTHLDADSLNAFTENALAASERARVLKHLANCFDCREIVALSLPQPDTTQQEVRSAAPGWFSWPVLRWGAAVACIVVVGAAVSLRYRERTQLERAPAPTSEVAELKMPPTATTAAPNALSDTKESAASERKVRVAKPEARQLAAKKMERADISNSPPTASGAAVQASEPSAPASTTTTVEVTTQSPAIQMRDQDMVPGRAKDALQSTNQGGGTGGGVLAKQKIASAAPMAAASLPAPVRVIPRWTLTSNGILQRSLDSGRSWQTISLPSQGQFRALSASGLEIWVAGSSGALYHSSDAGSSWTQVQPTIDGQALTADIIGVEFTDTLHGTVTTSSGNSLATNDAGQTWRKK